MATKETWSKLRYFKKNGSDNWGDVDAISDVHLLRLDDFRHFIGVPITVTHGVKTSGHSKKSFHYRKKDKNGLEIGACATDIMIPDYPGSPFDLMMDAMRFGFTGLGYYPHWKYKGKMCGGLHLDSRPLRWDSDKTINYSHSRWMGIYNEAGKQIYIELSFANLIKYAKYPSDEVDLDIH